jgi:hypothetical protein
MYLAFKTPTIDKKLLETCLNFNLDELDRGGTR